jgi:hypothetical protein
MVEELGVLGLQRSDLARDERVDLGEQGIGGGRNCLNPSRV